MLRLTKLANTVLTKKYHDIPDGDLILTGQLKPFMSGNMLDVESPELLFCSVKACLEAASYKCDQVNESDNPCSDMNFCVVHGPDRQLHNSKSLKTLKDYEELRQRYNEELFMTAIKKVQDKLDTLKVTEVKKKAIRNKSITQISTLIINKDEVTTQITSKKVKDKDAIIAKNQKFLQKVDTRVANNNPSKAVDTDFINSMAINDSNDAEMQRNKKAKHDYGGSVSEKLLLNAVNNLIDQANDGGRRSKHINFEVYMEEQLNNSYYWTKLHTLIELYNLPTDVETRTLLDSGFSGNSNEANNTRLRFIRKICQLLRNEGIVVGDLVTSTRNRNHFTK